jgi:ubiquitin carboxyl-terminal hydrolase 5/13
MVIDGIMTAMTFSRKEEIKAWEQEFVPCEHTLCLTQEHTKQAASTGIDILQNSTRCDANKGL